MNGPEASLSDRVNRYNTSGRIDSRAVGREHPATNAHTFIHSGLRQLIHQMHTSHLSASFLYLPPLII